MAGQDRAARLRHRITLQRPLLTQHAGGDYALAWEDAGDAWAEIKPVEPKLAAGGEVMLSEQLVPRAAFLITLRYREEVRADMRVVYQGRFFAIRSICNPEERNETLVLLAEEHTAN